MEYKKIARTNYGNYGKKLSDKNDPLIPLELQTRFGDKPLKFHVMFPQSSPE